MNEMRVIKGRVLVLDFDDVILSSERLIDRDIAKYWYTASDRYARDLERKFDADIIKTRDELDAELEIYRDKKNQILEEVYPHFEGKINYKGIISPQNISPLIAKQVRTLIRSNRYEMVIIESHYNSETEKKCKEQLINKLFPGAFFLPVRFFEADYIESKKNNTPRTRTSKAEYLMDYLNFNSVSYDFRLFTLIDNSPGNIKDWISHGGVGIIFGNSSFGDTINDLDSNKIINIENRFAIRNVASDDDQKRRK